MKLKLCSLSIFYFYLLSPIFSQVQQLTDSEVGYFYDVNGTLINSYLDYSYKPENLLDITKVIKGKKIVLKGELKDKLKDELNGEQLANKFDHFKLTYVLRTDYNGAIYKNYYLSSPNKGKERLKDFFKGPFQKQLLETFHNYEIPKYIEKEDELGPPDIESIMRLLKLEYYYQENKLFYLDENWKDVTLSKSRKKKYYFKVDSITNHKIFLSTYNLSDELLYNYSILLKNPDNKKGWYHYFNKQQVASKSLFYNFNDVDSVKTYYNNGKPFESYYEDNFEYIFKSVKNKLGEEILSEKGSGSTTIYDSIMDREIIKEYSENKLKAAYYFKDNSKHYLLGETPASYKFFNKFSDHFNKKFKPKRKDKSIYAEGLTLIHCVVDKEGKILESKVKLSANPKTDLKISNWMKSYNGKAFKPAKIDGEEVKQEVLIPIRYYNYIKYKKYKYNLR